jgi:multiple sugar transport system ATP-binding protein
MAEVELSHIYKVYDDGTTAVDDLNLRIDDGEFMVLVGPSGCGKTTALRMIAGLEEISAGDLKIGGRVLNNVPSKDRDIAMVFQNYALYPHLSVADNMGFGLKLRKTPKAEIAKRVDRAAQILGLTELLQRKPRALSGGQRQRVAMGRAIVREPQAFLMDEPLSNLDAKLRVQTRAEVARLQRELNVTTIYVTHDQTEAMTMGDRVAVMRKGVLQQVNAPQVLYDNPSNVFVAAFIGSPAMNVIEATLRDDNGSAFVTAGSQILRLADSVLAQTPSLREHFGKPVLLGIRPEDAEDAAVQRDAPPEQTLEATIDLVEQLGSEAYVHFTIDARSVSTDEASGRQEAAEISSPFVARVSPRTELKKGDVAKLVVDTARVHFFDKETGATLM